MFEHLKDTTITIRISLKDKAKLSALAKEHGLTMSDLIDIKVKQLISDSKENKLDSDIKVRAFDKAHKRQGSLFSDSNRRTV